MKLNRFHHFFAELQHSPVQKLVSAELDAAQLEVYVKRDDLLHPIVSGNKWRKLKHLMLSIEAQGYRKVAAMGGIHSNLLHALSYLCYRLGWPCELWLRGHAGQQLTPMMQDSIKWGASYRFVDRLGYRQLRQQAPQLANDTYWISEGAADDLALPGMSEMMMELDTKFDYLVAASATGTSIAGMAAAQIGKQSPAQVVGIAVLQNREQQISDIAAILGEESLQPEIVGGFTFGGYAKTNDRLSRFIAAFQRQHSIPLEPVYSGKSFYAVMQLAQQGYFNPGSKILLIHCGGLQGRRG